MVAKKIKNGFSVCEKNIEKLEKLVKILVCETFEKSIEQVNLDYAVIPKHSPEDFNVSMAQANIVYPVIPTHIPIVYPVVPNDSLNDNGPYIHAKCIDNKTAI